MTDEKGPVDYDGDEGKNGWIYYDNKVSPKKRKSRECQLRAKGETE